MAEEEPLVEKATTKTPWRRLVGSAAVASLILGVVAATALSAASGAAQTSLKSSHKSSHKKPYIVNIACLDKDNNGNYKGLWSTSKPNDKKFTRGANRLAGGWVSSGVGDVKNTPMFHLTFKNWDLGGNGVWSPSEMCNYGQSRDWKLSLKGKDLNDNYDKNNMCPSTHAW